MASYIRLREFLTWIVEKKYKMGNIICTLKIKARKKKHGIISFILEIIYSNLTDILHFNHIHITIHREMREIT